MAPKCRKGRRSKEAFSYSANVRVEVHGSEIEVTIFGDFESIRLLDSYLLSRIKALTKIEEVEFSQTLGAITYDDLTGTTFDEAADEIG